MKTPPKLSAIPGAAEDKTIAITAPSDAPEETPKVVPSANGLRNKPCIAAPQIDKEAPIKHTVITLGSLTSQSIVSSKVNPVLPAKTQITKTKRLTKINAQYNNMDLIRLLINHVINFIYCFN